MLLKTKTVSDRLDVNPSTIQRWVKYFELPCHKNNHGHLLFNEQDIQQLKDIKEHLSNGLSKEDVVLYKRTESNDMGIDMIDYERKLENMVSRMDGVEEVLSKKADEVVSFQLYQHRNEIEHLTKTMDDVKNRLQTIETQLSYLNTPQQSDKKENAKKEKKVRKNWLVSIFST